MEGSQRRPPGWFSQRASLIGSDAQPLSLGKSSISSLLEALCLDSWHRNGQCFGCGSARCLTGGQRVEEFSSGGR